MGEVYMPNLGMTMQQGKVLEWFVEDQAEVSEGEEIVEVASETEKLTRVLEAPCAGKITILLAADGSMVPHGNTIAVIK